MATEDSLIDRMAANISGFTRDQVTDPALQVARAAILDTIGVTLGGAAEPCVQILLRTPGVAEAGDAATAFGAGQRMSALDAALINGTAGHALDYDDFSEPMGGHQSVPLVAPLFALAEAHRLSGEQVLTSYVVGIETEIRIARAVNFHHYDKGWHPTATLGVFGAAAATAHLLGLGARRTAHALAIAASLASGVKANFGTMTKPLQVGQCCRNGLLATLLAQGGFDSNREAMEAKQGFLNAFNGPGLFDAGKMLENWGAPLEVESPSMGVKQFPCCGSTHPAVAAMLALVREHAIAADQVRRIEILPHARRLPHTDNPRPHTDLGAKFSVQYAVACALLHGGVRLEHFENAAYEDPRIVRILEMTQARPHPGMPDDSPTQFSAEVIVTLKDGRVLGRRIDDLVGRGGDNPMSRDEMWEKFHDCGKRALPEADLQELFERLNALEAEPDVFELAFLLHGPSAPGGKSSTRTTSNTLLETSWVP